MKNTWKYLSLSASLAGLLVISTSASALNCWRGMCEVELDDTVAKLANHEEVSVANMQAALGLTDPRQLRAGQMYAQSVVHDAIKRMGQAGTMGAIGTSLRPGTPYQETYTVEAGETLYSVMRKTGVSWIRIAEYNNLQAPYALSVGQVLNISPVKYK